MVVPKIEIMDTEPQDVKIIETLFYRAQLRNSVQMKLFRLEQQLSEWRNQDNLLRKSKGKKNTKNKKKLHIQRMINEYQSEIKKLEKIAAANIFDLPRDYCTQDFRLHLISGSNCYSSSMQVFQINKQRR